MILGMAKGWKDTQMVTDTRASSKEANRMAKEFIAGQTVKSTKENGWEGLKMDKVSGREYSVTLTLENGNKVKLMAMVFINGKMEIDSKANGTIA